MRLATFEVAGRMQPGVVIGDCVIALHLLDTSLPDSVLGILEQEQGLGRVRSLVERIQSTEGSPLKTGEKAATTYSVAQVKWMPPVPNARKLLCLAGNYEEHIQESGRVVAKKDRVTPRVFLKPASTTLCGHGSPILLSRHSRFVDYEAELAVIIGRRGKYIPVATALKYVAGYSCLNDISERRFRIRDRAESEAWDEFFDWLAGKWFDNAAPMGPWMVTTDEIQDPQNLKIELKVNGEIRQSSNTRRMIFSVAELIHYVSQFLTLEPGDIIATGTPAGVGISRGESLQSGDRVEMTIEKIGCLCNLVQAEPSPAEPSY